MTVNYRDPTHIKNNDVAIDTAKLLPQVEKLTKYIREKMYGIDVREALALSLELLSNFVSDDITGYENLKDEVNKYAQNWREAVSQITDSTEVIEARISLDGTSNLTLKEHLDKIESKSLSTKNTSTITLLQNYQKKAQTNILSAEINLSELSEGGTNIVYKKDDGIFVPNGEVGIPALNSLIETDNDRDPQAIEFVLSPHIARNAVMQHVHYDTTLGNWFITQSDNRTPEGFVMSRVNAGGELISNMYFKASGHGSGVFLKANERDLPTVYFQTGGSYREIKYGDNTTITATDAPIAFTPPTGAGNGMADFNDKYFVNNDNQGPRRNISIYEQQFVDGKFKFGEVLAQIDITDQINVDTNALQGIALVNRREITGENNDNVYVMVLAGTATIKIDILLYEFDPTTTELIFVKEIDKLENVVIPTFDKTGVNWNFFEAEGINVIRTSDGVNNSVGVVYGITANVLGKRKQYIYGFMNGKLSATLSSARASISDTKSALFTYDTETKLSSYTNPGEYELSANLAMKYEDFPSIWRFVNSQADWILNVSANNQNGDIVQTLTRRGVASPMEIYIRTINYSANDFGAGYLPTGIAPWNVIKMDNQQTRMLTSTNYVKFKKLSDFSAPGISYYVTATNHDKITDYEGIGDYIGNRGFKITTDSWAGAADQIFQKIEFFNNGTYMTAVRILSVTRETYGPQMIVNTSTLPKWSVMESKQI